jgi:hypothetical protein
MLSYLRCSKVLPKLVFKYLAETNAPDGDSRSRYACKREYTVQGQC